MVDAAIPEYAPLPPVQAEVEREALTIPVNRKGELIHEAIAIGYLPQISGESESPQMKALTFLEAVRGMQDISESGEEMQNVQKSLRGFWQARAQVMLASTERQNILNRELGEEMNAYTEEVERSVLEKNVDMHSREATAIRAEVLADFLQKKAQTVDEVDTEVFSLVIWEYKREEGLLESSANEIQDLLQENNAERLYALWERAFSQAKELAVTGKSISAYRKEVYHKLKKAQQAATVEGKKEAETRAYEREKGRELVRNNEIGTYWEMVIDLATYAKLLKIQEYVTLPDSAFYMKKAQALARETLAKTEFEAAEKAYPPSRKKKENPELKERRERYERANDAVRVFNEAEAYKKDPESLGKGRKSLEEALSGAKREAEEIIGELQEKLIKDLENGLIKKTPENERYLQHFLAYANDFGEEGFLQNEELWRVPSKFERFGAGTWEYIKKWKKGLMGLFLLFVQIFGLEIIGESRDAIADFSRAS